MTRGTGAPLRRPRAPALALVVLGAGLVVGPVAGGMFAKTAAGRQMIDRFAPHMQAGALDRYGSDVATLRQGAAALQTVYAQQAVPPGRFPGLDVYRTEAPAIDARAQHLLDRITAAQPDYRRVASIGGFDRVPFLIVLCGLVAVYGGIVLLTGTRRRSRSGAALVIVASAALSAYPFLSGMERGGAAGQRMLHEFAPVMTQGEVRQLQSDFVVLVTAVGELDTGFKDVPTPGPAASDLRSVVTAWPTISSDFASIVGVVNDDISDFHGLSQLDALPRHVGLPGFEAFPWMFVGIGAVSAGLAVAAWPRRRKETV